MAQLTHDPQKDLDIFYDLLHKVAAEKFKDHFEYDFNGDSTQPHDLADDGTSFASHEDKTNCPTIKDQAINSYVNDEIFGAHSDLPKKVVNPMRDDLLGNLKPRLKDGVFDGWKSFNHEGRYENVQNKPDVKVAATFIYTIVNAADGNGDLTPTMFLYYVGGFYHAKTGL